MKPLGAPILSGLITASLLMHVVLGCCWHHAHAQSAEGLPSVPQHVLHLANANGSAPGVPCHNEETCSQRCVYTYSPSVRAVMQPSLASCPAVAFLPVMASELSSSLTVIRQERPRPHGLEPLRIHLWYQVLLT